MNDYGVSVLEAYELDILRTYRGRGALIIEAKQGVRILREFTGNPERLSHMNELLTHIRENGVENTDMLVRNKDGEFVTTNKEHVSYVMKEWFPGEECNARNREDVVKAAKNLAHLHAVMECPKLSALTKEKGEGRIRTLKSQCESHTRELRRTKSFMSKKSKKGSFEKNYLAVADSYIEKADEVCKRLEREEDEELYNQVVEKGIYCHGDYNQHNLLIFNEQMRTINFEHYINDTRVRDLCNFCRKTAEKNNWDIRYGDAVINSYHAILPLSPAEWKNLYFRLSYPEKFWKISNHYYNHSKAFISDKNMEKLNALTDNEDRKEKFLKELFHM